VREVRRVLQQPPALVQSLEHELQLAVVEVEDSLLQVPHLDRGRRRAGRLRSRFEQDVVQMK
jgi:hypothetical protein